MNFEKGQIVYFVKKTMYSKPFVWFGMVDCEFVDCVRIDFLHRPDMRMVNGIPIEDFYNDIEIQRKWHKLPKGWTYNTPLFKPTVKEFSEEQIKEYKECDIRNPESIMSLYNKGLLVKCREIPTLNLYPIDIIDKDRYRVKLEHCSNISTWHTEEVGNFYHKRKYDITDNSVIIRNCYNVYKTYDEAQAEVDEYLKEQEIAKNMTEEEWSLKEIKESARLFCYNKNHPGKWIDIILDWFSKIPNLKDIETRNFGGYMQWKYCYNKRWNPLPEELIYELERS